jgi:hypothetical protein
VWSLVEYEGKLAVTLPWTPETDEPVESRDLWVSPKEKWDEEYYKRFTQVRLIENNYFRCFNSLTYREEPLLTPGWMHVHEQRPIKPPGRGGKDWSWEWSMGRWIKSYF